MDSIIDFSVMCASRNLCFLLENATATEDSDSKENQFSEICKGAPRMYSRWHCDHRKVARSKFQYRGFQFKAE